MFAPGHRFRDFTVQYPSDILVWVGRSKLPRQGFVSGTLFFALLSRLRSLSPLVLFLNLPPPLARTPAHARSRSRSRGRRCITRGTAVTTVLRSSPRFGLWVSQEAARVRLCGGERETQRKACRWIESGTGRLREESRWLGRCFRATFVVQLAGEAIPAASCCHTCYVRIGGPSARENLRRCPARRLGFNLVCSPQPRLFP